MQKATGFRVSLEILDTSGYAVTGAHAVTAMISKDGAAYAATTNPPVTASATVPQVMTFLLTDTEANADYIHIIGGAPNCVVPSREFYPEANYTAAKSLYLDASITSRAAATGIVAVSGMAQVLANTTAINANVDVPVSSRAASAVLATVKTQTDTIPNLATSGVVAGIKTQTDKIPTLAVSGTALSINDWSVTRATKLDNLDAAVTSRAAATGIVAVSGMAAILSNTTTTNSRVDVTVSSRASSGVQASGQVVLDKFTFTGSDVNAAATVDTSNVASASGLSQAISSLNSVAASATSAQEVLDQFVFSTPGKVDATAGALAPEDIVNISSSVTGALSVAGVTLAENAIDASAIAAGAVAKIQAGLALSGTALSNATWTADKANMLDASVSSRAASSVLAGVKTQTDKIPSLAVSGTALSNVEWTPTRAIKLDSLDAAVSSRAAASGIVAVSGMAAILSNTTTTNSRVDVPVSSRAASATALDKTIWTDIRAGLLDLIASRAPSATALDKTVWVDNLATLISTNIDTTISSRMAAGAEVEVAVGGISSGAFTNDAVARIQSGLAASGTALSNQTWTNTLANNLTLLDASISSRAASATALSNAVWTNALAAMLDAPISSRAASAIWTTAKAALLDAAITSRAASATALDSSVWTELRASFLDAPMSSAAASAIWDATKAAFLDAAVSSRATSGIQMEDHAVIDQFVFTTPGKVDALAAVDVDEAAIAAAITASMGGSGSVEWVHTVTNSTGLPQGNAWVAYYTDEARTILAVQGYTDTQGEVTFKLNPRTYYTKTVVPGFDVKKEVVPVA